MDALRKMQSIFNFKKMGHAGTLDPLATGVLIVCTGKMTKKINEFMNMQKEYITEIDLSAFSSTDDGEGQIQHVEVTTIPTQQDVEKVLQYFIGSIEQIPPKFSAIKIQGRRAYKKAKAQEDFNMPPRTVTIHSLELLNYSWPKLTIKVICSKGTYIRSLGRDIGKQLKTGGYLTKLTRMAIGPYTLDQAQTLEELNEQAKSISVER